MTNTTEAALVSIIIPTFRRPVDVRAAVLSALAQTWEKIEVIVVSDGPDPETRKALHLDDSRLRYLELPRNQGPAAARNAGVAASQGEWLTYLDDDDRMLPGKVERQMSFADSTKPALMVACRTIYKHGFREDVWPANPIGPDEDLADYLLLRRSLRSRPGVVALQTLLMHRSMADANPFTSHDDHEDWAWLMKVWHQCQARITFVWEPLVVYNVATENESRSRRTNWQHSLRWAQEHRAWIGDRAYCSFLSTKVALKAKRAGDRKALQRIGWEIFRNSPGTLEIAFYLGILLAPPSALHGAWKRSLEAPSSAVRNLAPS